MSKKLQRLKNFKAQATKLNCAHEWIAFPPSIPSNVPLWGFIYPVCVEGRCVCVYACGGLPLFSLSVPSRD